MVRTIELDVVGDEGFVPFMDDLSSKGLEPTVKQWNGPGGGNPLITLTGTREAIEEALTPHGFEDLDIYFN